MIVSQHIVCVLKYHRSLLAKYPPFRNIITLDFERFTVNLSRCEVSCNQFNWFWRPTTVVEINVRSSAKSRMKSSTWDGVRIAPCFPFAIMSFASSLIKMENRIGLRRHPCFKPCIHTKKSVSVLPHLTQASTEEYIDFNIFIILPFMPVFNKTDLNRP